MTVPLHHAAAVERFEIDLGDAVAFLQYEVHDGRFVLMHTEVPESLRGQHLGDRLVDAAIAWADARGLRLVVVCPFARALLKKRGVL